jgi:hypothetical protein
MGPSYPEFTEEDNEKAREIFYELAVVIQCYAFDWWWL